MSKRFSAVADNYNPPRTYLTGTITAGRDDIQILAFEWDTPKDATRAVYLLDDGKAVIPYYVAGWDNTNGELFIQPFPTNPTGETRPDNGRVIDYSTWRLGPTRAYHLKVKTVDSMGMEVN